MELDINYMKGCKIALDMYWHRPLFSLNMLDGWMMDNQNEPASVSKLSAMGDE